MLKIKFIPASDFRCVRESSLDKYEKLALLADMCRVNTLASVKRAGSGHLGSSLSSMEIITWLYNKEMNTVSCGFDSPERDIYFSSKGHDVPGFYALMHSFGVLPDEKLGTLRRLGGLDGHPDIHIKGVEANSGSLGMGVSKGRGMAWAKRSLGHGGRVIVMTGDGEMQEGQNYEAFANAVQQRVDNLVVIMDHNKVQTDKPVAEVVDLGDFAAKLRAFGWQVERCDGHDFRQLDAAFSAFAKGSGRPKFLIADTIKGKGVSFMEHPGALKAGNGLYPWHAGAPDDEKYEAAQHEIISRVESRLKGVLPKLSLKEFAPLAGKQSASALIGEQLSVATEKVSTKVSDEFVSKVFGEALAEAGGRRKDIVVLNADLSADCKLRPFEGRYPERFIECGIAEQDMVSMAGGLARSGFLPVVNSFASFLASRANEQIYNNASERSKIIYGLHYAGLIPAGPGKSHQSVRDVSLLGALPNCVILQPCNAEETVQAFNYCVDKAVDTCALRLIIGPSPRKIKSPAGWKLEFGKGVELAAGCDVALFAYGPVMLHEALLASEILAEKGVKLKVLGMPWLNRVDLSWLSSALAGVKKAFCLEDHAPQGGLGDFLLASMASAGLLNGRDFVKFAVEGYPACGTPSEALKFHALDGASLAQRIGLAIKK